MHEHDARANEEATTWLAKLQAYAIASNSRAIVELTATLIPFIALWVVMRLLLDVSYLLALGLALPAAGLLIRLFLIQHDCGHGSFLDSSPANHWLGRVLGVLTLTPYDDWKHAHAIHHASSGNLEKRGIGDISTLTVAEFASLSKFRQFAYRLYRHPLIMFGLGPLFVFGLRNRFPTGVFRAGWHFWLSAMANNVAIVVVVVIVSSLTGVVPFLQIQLPIWFFAAMAGIWLFFVQHQFESVYWARAKSWNRRAAALYGSSHYALPKVLTWLTANIGVHHVHHLASTIPSYKLHKVLRDHPSLGELNRIGFLESFRCMRLALFDEAACKMISFRDYRNQQRLLACKTT